MKKYLLLIVTVFLLVGCDSSWNDGPYEVYYDAMNDRVLGRNMGDGMFIGRVEGNVIAIGNNAKYISVKNRGKGYEIESYYFINKDKDGMYLNMDEITQGPFNKKHYYKLVAELGLPKLSKEFE